MPDDLKFRPGGSLKLKGDDDEGKKKKKSKRKNPSKVALTGNETIKPEGRFKLTEDQEKLKKTQNRDSPQASGSQGPKTDAERRFEKAQRKRLQDKVSKMASKTHKDRVHDFNAKLEQASEHYDIPKVGPG